MSAPYARGAVQYLFPDESLRPQDLSYLVDGRRIHYVQQDGGGARILFIHGTPGDWQGWAPYLRERNLQARATMIAVDRPGWGESESGGIVPNLEAQAALLRPLLGSGATGTLLVAHSYGGAVAARMAMDYPQQVRGLVMIAPTLSPDLEGLHWYDHLAAMLPARLLLPDRLRLAYGELAPLSAELRGMLPRWAGLHLPVAIIQGEDDEQVDPRTADFAEHELPRGLVKVTLVQGQGHWVLWTRPALITKAILATLERVDSTQIARESSPRQIPSS